ncbi:hypothetical protein HF086_001710 [Spodoptera exigua]|uniref:Glycosyltransferase family 92 protein n=1 Tax=Spodoptera exigua TaxID=7107 RepID=A0A922MPJ8_SPOEX|nr:hypothetical protein HF086_001710 [Spodoptera exigua]
MRLPPITSRRSFFIIITAFTILTLTWLSLPKNSHITQNPILFHSHSRLLPFRYWNHRSVYPDRYKDSSCMKFPEISDLEYAATSWQLLSLENGSVYIYGAYWDPRFEEPLVRILVYSDVSPLPKLYCQLWFPNDNEPQTELATPVYGWQTAWYGPVMGVNEPYILTCTCRRHPPEKEAAPVAVSVVTGPCGETSNVLNIQNAPFNNHINKRTGMSSHRNDSSIAVCLKWLHYRNDISTSLVEWLQLIKHFGADEVYIYILRIHPNLRKVLKYYVDQGFVVVTGFDHAPQVSGLKQSRSTRDFHDLRRELLPLNDCLYRNIMRHAWLLAIDLDEMIVPPANKTWSFMIERLIANTTNRQENRPLDSLVFQNYFVLDGAQVDLEGPAKTRSMVKSFVNTSSIIAMHNHQPLVCHEPCSVKYVDAAGPGRLLHFREKCSYNEKDCPELHDVVKDDTLASWRQTVLEEIKHVLQILDLNPLE